MKSDEDKDALKFEEFFGKVMKSIFCD